VSNELAETDKSGGFAPPRFHRDGSEWLSKRSNPGSIDRLPCQVFWCLHSHGLVLLSGFHSWSRAAKERFELYLKKIFIGCWTFAYFAALCRPCDTLFSFVSGEFRSIMTIKAPGW